MSAPDAPPDALAPVKQTARKTAFAVRKAAHASGAGAAKRAAAVFLERVSIGPAEIVSGYRPIRTEIDPTPLMLALHDRGIRLCVPVIQAAGAPLSFRRWTPDTPMTAGAFGAMIPAKGEILEPTLLIVPLLSFDRARYRLGYGGGFYDRTLERLRAARPTRAYGFAYAAQEIAATPRDSYDQRLDGVVTEKEMIC